MYCGDLCTDRMLYTWDITKYFLNVCIQVVVSIAPTHDTLIYDHISPLGLLARNFKHKANRFLFSLRKGQYITVYIYNSQNSHH